MKSPVSDLNKLDTKAKPGLILVQCELSLEEQETFTGHFFCHIKCFNFPNNHLTDKEMDKSQYLLEVSWLMNDRAWVSAMGS